MSQSLDQLLNSVMLEGETALNSRDAELYNFMQPANKTMRHIESKFGQQAIEPVIERLNDSTVDGPIVRVLLQFLLRSIPTRQTIFEAALSKSLPDWKTVLAEDREAHYAAEFQAAHQEALKAAVRYPDGFLAALIKATGSQYPDVAQFALRQCRLVGVTELLESCLAQADSPTANVRSCALTTAAALSVLDKGTNLKLRELALQSKRPLGDRLAGLDAWLVSSEADNAALEFVANYESILFNEPEFLNSVLDSSAVGADHLRQRLNTQLNPDGLPDSTLRRLRRLPEIAAPLSEAASARIADNLMMAATRSEPGRFGLLVHRNSDGVFVGHTGIFIGEDRVIDCTVGRDPRAVGETPFQEWKEGGGECWGIRRDCNHPVDLVRAVDRAREIASWRTEYDGSHNNQKGAWTRDWFWGPRYWEADCVGFTEHCYEHAGGNPTPDEFEVGAGWPLTPREQRDHMCKVFDC